MDDDDDDDDPCVDILTSRLVKEEQLLGQHTLGVSDDEQSFQTEHLLHGHDLV